LELSRESYYFSNYNIAANILHGLERMCSKSCTYSK